MVHSIGVEPDNIVAFKTVPLIQRLHTKYTQLFSKYVKQFTKPHYRQIMHPYA